MKKSLIIFLSLIFMNMTAHAVGVDCWEETSTTFTPDTVSKMQDILGDKVTITRVKTVLRIIIGSISNYSIAAGCTSSTCLFRYPDLKQVEIPLDNYLVATDSDKTVFYLDVHRVLPNLSSKNQYTISNGLYFRMSSTPRLQLTHPFGYRLATETTTYGESLHLDDYTTMDYGGGYIHTFCIADTSSGSGGGGGGAAGAAVNYIIKAK